ncbi:MAG: hypothetical protein PHF00_11790, partial [Elusimicrobia bacterium]|nr:hypothetical protein [Elusimicrobiota bacterium]
KIKAVVDGVVGNERLFNPALTASQDWRSPAAKFLDAPDQVQEALKRLFSGTEESIASQRNQVKNLLRGFKVSSRRFRYAPSPRLTGAASCRKQGADRKAALLALLSAGRPAGVGMNLKGLAAWHWSQRLNFIEDVWHAFLITGYDMASDGRIIFHTRNSWEGHNPEVLEDELCRISKVYSVEAPGEQDALYPKPNPSVPPLPD